MEGNRNQAGKKIVIETEEKYPHGVQTRNIVVVINGTMYSWAVYHIAKVKGEAGACDDHEQDVGPFAHGE